jgi:WD40 repeat protein
MKPIHRIITVILLSLFFQSQTTIEKGTNEISRTEQKMQGLGKLELVIQNGHTGAVNGILLTKDEKKLISYSADNTIKIWDMKEEKLLKTLEGHAGAVRGILLVNDDRMLISYSDDMTLKMWDLETGKTLNYAHQSDKLAFDVQDIHLTRNEKGLFIFDKRQRQISFVDVEGKKVWDWGLRDGIDGLFGLTKDGQKLVSYSRSGIIQIWRINDIGWGELIATMEGHTKKVTGIKLSQDEKKIISYSSDGSIKIWDIENGKLHKTLVEQNAEIKGMQLTKDGAKLIYFDEEAIRILDMQNDRLFKTLEGQSVEKIQLANEDNILISYGKSRIKIWDMNEGKLLKHFGNWYFESSDRYNSYSVGEAGEEEVYFDSREKFEAAIAGLLRMAPRHADKITGVQITSNGRKLISSSADNTIKMWDIKTKNILKSFEAHNDSVNKYIVNNTIIEKIISRYKRGTILAKRNVGGISHFYKTIKFWNTFESRLFEKISIEDSSSLISSLIDIDQNLLFEFHIDGKIDIFDFETRKLLKSLEGHSHTVNGIQLTKDGKKIISYSYDKSIRIWDFESGKLLILFEGHLESVRGIQLTKDEKKIISYSWDNTIKIWELETGKLILNLEWPVYGADGIQLTNDEKKLISYSSLDGIKIWDFENGKILKTIENSYQERIKSSDGSLRYWNIETGKLLVTQLLFKNGHSIYYTPDGYFDYTDKSVLEFISFVSPKIQNNFVDLQDLMNDYYLDGLLELVTNNKFKPNKKNNLTKGVETTAVVKALFETQESVESAEDNKSLHFQITERGSKFEKAVVYVNGIQVDEKTLVDGENTEGVNLEDDSKEGFFKYRVKFSVPLNFGTNRVEVKAYNAFNIPQSFPAFEIQRKIPDNKELAKPDLYILSVGINDYKTKKLTFSVPDAKAMAEALQQGKTGIYHEVFTRLLVDAKKKTLRMR